MTRHDPTTGNLPSPRLDPRRKLHGETWDKQRAARKAKTVSPWRYFVINEHRVQKVVR